MELFRTLNQDSVKGKQDDLIFTFKIATEENLFHDLVILQLLKEILLENIVWELKNIYNRKATKALAIVNL